MHTASTNQFGYRKALAVFSKDGKRSDLAADSAAKSSRFYDERVGRHLIA